MNDKIAVLLSGNGSNLKAIMNSGIKISFVASNNPNAKGLNIAKEAGIFTFSSTKLSILEEQVLKLTLKYNVSLIVLAGFMRLLSKSFLKSLPEKFIINIHPSILPAFKGLNAIEQAIEKCVQYTGVTVHYVDEGMDTGSIIEQKKVKIYKNDTKKSLQTRLKATEHCLYPETIKKILLKQLKNKNNL